MDDGALRQGVIDGARAMQESGLSPQRSGNVSARSGGGFLITPTGMAYDALEQGDVAYVAMDGSQPANHGQIAFGDSLTSALELAHEVEDLCAQYWRARQIGAPVLLDDAEMDRVIAKFAGYGQQPEEGA